MQLKNLSSFEDMLENKYIRGTISITFIFACLFTASLIAFYLAYALKHVAQALL